MADRVSYVNTYDEEQYSQKNQFKTQVDLLVIDKEQTYHKYFPILDKYAWFVFFILLG